MWNLVFLFTGMFFILLLLFVFLTKKVVNTAENKIFKLITIFNLIGYISEISLQLVVRNIGVNSVPSLVLSKIYLLIILLWFTTFSIYTLMIGINSENKDRYNKIFNIQKVVNAAVGLIGSLLLCLLPIKFYYDKTRMYSYGMSVDALKLLIIAYSLIWIIILIINIKRLNNKKFVPMFLIIILLVLSVILQTIDPGILISTMVGTFICYTMFFTIENPDMKLLEETYRAKEISDKANEEKTLFLLNMTQEIRGITNIIDDDADLILDSKELDDIYNQARDIKLNTSKFTNITNDILDVSSMDSGTLKVYNSKYNIKTILKEIVSIYSSLSKKKGLKFITNIDHDVPEILYGDSIGLKEILNTVLENSIKYTEKGYIELSVNTVIKKDICRLIITVEDSGIGIRSEEINEIKINNKSLSKANNLITVMNGAMLISSDYGVGTKVKLVLDQKMEKNDNTEIAKYEDTFDNVSILCVDDSDAGLKIIEKTLKGAKIKLDFVNTGKGCIDKLRINKYDIVLLDEHLTQITGIELMKKIKEIRNFNAPVILLTKDTSYEYNDEWSKLGFSDYILKPIKKDILIEKIDKYTKKDFK